MKKRVFCTLLALIMVLSLVPVTASAADDYVAKPTESKYFYNQLNERAKAIYDLLYEEFTKHKDQYLDGTKTIELTGHDKIASDADVENYIKGNKDIFNDFAAAKDALDLDHSELWWVDSGYLTFRATNENGKNHLWVGPGRGNTYLLAGQTKIHDSKTVKEMDEEVEKAIQNIVDTAVKEANAADHEHAYSKADKTAALVRSVHDQIVRSISYRFENECKKGNEKYIRTLYGLVTHEGVCESYARTLQVCLTRLGIESVLIHGLQTKGTPEDHMWNAVRIDDDTTNEERWYVVDATWDDPLTADWYGRRDLVDVASSGGNDGKENTTYLLVGQVIVGEHWVPSGYVSTGNFEFKYPEIQTSSYDGSTAFQDENGLKVMYSAGSGSMEDGTPAGVFKVTFQGMNLTEAAKKGFYFMLKMYDYHPDGTKDEMDEWYYCAATLAVAGSNKYFCDEEDGLHVYTGTCEYVDVAVTTCKPQDYDQWASRTDWGPYWEQGYYHGTDNEIVAQSGMLYNTNSSYEAPPYVFRQNPPANCQAVAGYQYRFDVLWDDELYHPVNNAGIATVDMFVDNSEQAANQEVKVRYATYQQDLRDGSTILANITGDLPFDKDRDGYVDMDGNYTDFQWHYVYTKDNCPNKEYHEEHPEAECDVTKGCRIDGVAFNFRGSDMWQDDITEYTFILEGVVGSRSSKFPNNFGVVCQVPGLCPACYRSQGIDWNLWGKPSLLDTGNIDLGKMAVEGIDDVKNLEDLQAKMNVNDLNGRLLLVVDDNSKGSGSREDYEKVNGELEDELGVKDSDIKSSSIYEINFNRICPMVKLKPGESLRVQVGYPEGITYEMLTGGNENVVLKAYHFTRCDASLNNDCPYLTKELEGAKSDYERNQIKKDHAWNSHVIGVNEIQVIPNPYGMVIICDAFSPFEIVVFDGKSDAVKKVVEESDFSTDGNIVTVVSDENGYVTVDGKKAVGTDGLVSFKVGETKTFTVVPHDGYELDTVSYGGTEIESKDGKTFTFTYDQNTKNDVLSVTFLPTEIKEEEKKEGITSVVTKVCGHENVETISARENPSCTKAGHTAETKCKDCGMTLSTKTEIPALGHTLVVETPAQEPTCTTDGKRAVIKCSVCGEKTSNGETVPAIGHLFTDYHYEDDDLTCQGVIKTATCDRPGCNAVHTFTDPSEKGDHVYEYTTTSATCTTDGVKIGTCKWCKTTTEPEVVEHAKGHTIGDNGLCSVCGSMICPNGEHKKLVTIPGTPATCTEQGTSDGEKCEECGLITKQQTITPALGHDFPEHDPHEEQVECTRCHEKSPMQDHTPETVPAVPPTCETTGLTEGSRCSVCHDVIVAQTEVPALGHKWNTDADSIEWVWSEEGEKVTASAVVTCENDNTHTKAFEAEVTYDVIKDPTCTENGEGKYTATVTIDDVVCTDDHDETLIIPATGHTFGEWEDNDDATCTKYGTETRKCENCDVTETRETTEMLEHDFITDLVPPTCTTDGKITDTCVVCGHTEVKEEIPALGHHFENGACTLCKIADPDYVPPEPEPEPEPEKPKPSKPRPGIATPVTPSEPEPDETEPEPDQSTTPETPSFPDVLDGQWYAEAVATVASRGLIVGDEKGNFNPNMLTGRGQLMTILARLNGVDTTGSSPWYKAGMDWAVANGVSDGTNPLLDVPREQFVTMLYRYVLKFVGEQEITGDLSQFPDAASVHDWAVEAMTWAVQNEIVHGTGDGLLAPETVADRATAAQLLANFLAKFDL